MSKVYKEKGLTLEQVVHVTKEYMRERLSVPDDREVSWIDVVGLVREVESLEDKLQTSIEHHNNTIEQMGDVYKRNNELTSVLESVNINVQEALGTLNYSEKVRLLEGVSIRLNKTLKEIKYEHEEVVQAEIKDYDDYEFYYLLDNYLEYDKAFTPSEKEEVLSELRKLIDEAEVNECKGE